MHLKLILVGKTETGHVAAGLAFYTERISRSARFREVVVPESRRKEPDARKQEEAGAILKATGDATLVLLDERGAGLGSVAFAEKLGKWRDQGVRDLAFVIGGAYGVDDSVRKRAAFVLSLSPMTFPHQLVRVLFAEQLYRAFTLLEGRKYHHP